MCGTPGRLPAFYDRTFTTAFTKSQSWELERKTFGIECLMRR
jgi:hypothetical protein